MKTNFEHLRSLSVRRMAAAIWNLCNHYCAYCPRNMTRRCNGDCATGLWDWLNAPYIPSSDVWKEKKK